MLKSRNVEKCLLLLPLRRSRKNFLTATLWRKIGNISLLPFFSWWRVGFFLHFHRSRVNLFSSSEKFHQRAGEIFKYRNCHSFNVESISGLLALHLRMLPLDHRVTSIFGKKKLFLNRLVIKDLWRKNQNYWRDSLPSETTRMLRELFGQINLTYNYINTPWRGSNPTWRKHLKKM